MTEALQTVVKGLELAQRRGAYNLEEASAIYSVSEIVKTYIPTPDIVKVIEIFKDYLIKDPEYRKSWEDNIAMAFKDEHELSAGAFTIAEIANSAAKRIIDQIVK